MDSIHKWPYGLIKGIVRCEPFLYQFTENVLPIPFSKRTEAYRELLPWKIEKDVSGAVADKTMHEFAYSRLRNKKDVGPRLTSSGAAPSPRIPPTRPKPRDTPPTSAAGS